MAFRRTRCPGRSRVEDALFWTGAAYNLCAVHRMLDATPANLTDHVWTIDELLRFTPRRIRYFVVLPYESCDVYKSPRLGAKSELVL